MEPSSTSQQDPKSPLERFSSIKEVIVLNATLVAVVYILGWLAIRSRISLATSVPMAVGREETLAAGTITLIAILPAILIGIYLMSLKLNLKRNQNPGCVEQIARFWVVSGAIGVAASALSALLLQNWFPQTFISNALIGQGLPVPGSSEAVVAYKFEIGQVLIGANILLVSCWAMMCSARLYALTLSFIWPIGIFIFANWIGYSYLPWTESKYGGLILRKVHVELQLPDQKLDVLLLEMDSHALVVSDIIEPRSYFMMASKTEKRQDLYSHVSLIPFTRVVRMTESAPEPAYWPDDSKTK